MLVELNKDEDSKLGTYYRINPTLQKYVPNPQKIMELERELVTRFRTGSHSLAIELGRYSNIPRDNRICGCGDSVQTIWHVFMQCSVTYSICRRNYQSLQEIFADENIHKVLLSITNKLRIQI